LDEEEQEIVTKDVSEEKQESDGTTDKIELDINSEELEKIKNNDERIKKGIGLGALVLGLYMMDRLLGEEKKIYISQNRYITVKKGFLEEFLE